MELLAVSAIGVLGAILLWAGFAHLVRRDVEEGEKNRQDACLYHEWKRMAGGGFRCAACHKMPQG